MIDLSNFLGHYRVRQGSSSSEVEISIQDTDKVHLDYYNRAENTYSIKVSHKDAESPYLTLEPLRWTEHSASLNGSGPQVGYVVEVSFYQQIEPAPLKVLYGTIIHKDPDSVGAWAADDSTPPEL